MKITTKDSLGGSSAQDSKGNAGLPDTDCRHNFAKSLLHRVSNSLEFLENHKIALNFVYRGWEGGKQGISVELNMPSGIFECALPGKKALELYIIYWYW